MTDPFISKCCEGERCWCNEPAEHKVEETIFPDDPIPHRHAHFLEMMGPAAKRAEDDVPKPGFFGS